MFHPDGPTFRELIRQALSSTERGYDLLAPKFDVTPFRTPDAVLETTVREIARLGPLDRGLDLCCGTGAGTRILQPLCREGVVGIDFSRGMLLEARRRTPAGRPPIDWVRGDVLRLPFRAAFDVAVCFGAFGHIERRDEARFVGQIADVLRPGGRFVFATTGLPPLWSPARWVARGFNAAMRIRNGLIAPPFIMYYLTFLLPEVGKLLEAGGFDVEVRRAAFAPPWTPLQLVIATRRGG